MFADALTHPTRAPPDSNNNSSSPWRPRRITCPLSSAATSTPVRSRTRTDLAGPAWGARRRSAPDAGMTAAEAQRMHLAVTCSGLPTMPVAPCRLQRRLRLHAPVQNPQTSPSKRWHRGLRLCAWPCVAACVGLFAPRAARSLDPHSPSLHRLTRRRFPQPRGSQASRRPPAASSSSSAVSPSVRWRS